jgi:MFS family permease
VFAPAGAGQVRRHLPFDVLAGIGVGVGAAMVLTLLPTAARREAVAPLGLAALASAPFLTNLVSAFTGRVGVRSTTGLAMFRIAGIGASVLLLVLPVAVAMIPVALLFWLSLSLAGPFHVRLWGQIYPARFLGRAMGIMGAARAGAMALAALVGGLLADRFGGPPAMALGGVVGALCCLGYLGLPRVSLGDAPAYTARSCVRVLVERPVLRRMVMAHAFYGTGVVAAVPLFALVHVDRLGLSLGEVGIVGIAGATAMTLAFPLMGMLADHLGGMTTMRVGTCLGLAGVLGYALAPGVAMLWLAAAAFGAGSAALDTGVVAVLSAETPLESRAASLAGWNASTAAWGIAAPFTMSFAVQAGIVSLTTALLLCAAVAGLGVLLYLGVTPSSLGPVRRAVIDSRLAQELRELRASTAER